MNIQQGDLFDVQDGGTIKVTHSDINKVKYQYIQNSSKKGEISQSVFQQFTQNGYFKAVVK